MRDNISIQTLTYILLFKSWPQNVLYLFCLSLQNNIFKIGHVYRYLYSCRHYRTNNFCNSCILYRL